MYVDSPSTNPKHYLVTSQQRLSQRLHTLLIFTILGDHLLIISYHQGTRCFSNMMRTLWLMLVVLGAHSFDLLPEPSGPFITGVRDFEFLDLSYPSPFANDIQGRRLMVRAWYPACLKTEFQNNTCGSSAVFGERKKYFADGEWAAYFGVEAPAVADTFETFSYVDAPGVAPNGQSRSVIIYGHGATMFVSDNTALMEEIASFGYAVFALGHPGIASGVLFPNGDVVLVDEEFIAKSTNPFDFDNGADLNIEARHNLMEQWLERDDPFPLRCKDDMLALADYLEDSLNNATSWIGQLIGEESTPSLIYMGFSYGGAAAGSAGQEDKRAKGAVNLDGLHRSLDLFGRAIQVPFLTFATETEWSASNKEMFYYNEFFFEPLESMETNPNVTRVGMPDNVTHLDLSDAKFFPLEFRQLLDMDGLVDGPHLHDILVSFCLGFLDTLTGKRLDWTPSQSFSQFNDTKPVNVSYVADWANGLSLSPTVTLAMSSAPMGTSTRTIIGSGPSIAVIVTVYIIAATLLF